MNCLAMDTATETLALCLRTQGETRTLLIQAGLKHSERLMPAVAGLLEQAKIDALDLDLVVCSTGPGSFTGIRIGLATAKGLAFAAASSSAPCLLIGVSTLDALAHRYRLFSGAVVAANPSLRRNHYAAVYREGNRQGAYLETSIPDLAASLEPFPDLLLTGGSAGALFHELGGSRCSTRMVVDASGQNADPVGLLDCGVVALERYKERGERPQEPAPLYLRKSEAEISFSGG